MSDTPKQFPIPQIERANALAAEVERLRMWKLRAEAAEAQEAHETACKEEAERQRDAAVAALKKYGDHGIFCGLVNNEAVCTCGYDEAIKECGK